MFYLSFLLLPNSQNVAFGDYARPTGGPPPPLAPLAFSPQPLSKVCNAKRPQLASVSMNVKVMMSHYSRFACHPTRQPEVCDAKRPQLASQ